MIRRMNEHLAEGNHVGRPRQVVARFFADVDLLEPGVVKVTRVAAGLGDEARDRAPCGAASGVSRDPPEPTEAMVARVRDSIERQGMMATLGVELAAIERGRVEMALRYDDRFTQQHGFLHAGAVASVLDSACGYAAYSVMPPDASVLTVTYTINLLAPAAGQRFTMTGQVVRAGRTLVVCRGEAFADGAERPFAAMQATMTALYDRPGISG